MKAFKALQEEIQSALTEGSKARTPEDWYKIALDRGFKFEKKPNGSIHIIDPKGNSVVVTVDMEYAKIYIADALKHPSARRRFK